MQLVPLPKRYIGADIVGELVETNQQRYADQNRQFMRLDLVADALPNADLVLCRDCLVHLCFDDILAALSSILRSGSTYLLTTTFPHRSSNRDIKNGGWRPLNLERPPFGLVPPLMLLNERNYLGTKYHDKSLGLWRLADLHI